MLVSFLYKFEGFKKILYNFKWVILIFFENLYLFYGCLYIYWLIELIFRNKMIIK